MTGLEESEIDTLEEMIAENRSISSDDELTAIYLEMLYIEEDKEKFDQTLKMMMEHMEDMLNKGNFKNAVLILQNMIELRKNLDELGSEKLDEVETFIESTKSKEVFITLRKGYKNTPPNRFDDFFRYLSLIGPQTLPLAQDLYEEKKDDYYLAKMYSYLREICRQDIDSLMTLTGEDKPELTTAVIAALGSSNDKEAIPHLTGFIEAVKRPYIKKSIKALGNIDDPDASKVLLPLLSDKEPAIRLLAAQNLQFFPDPSLIQHMTDLINSKPFIKKSIHEKTALLKFLGQQENSEAVNIFRNFIKKPGLFKRRKKIESAICAIYILKNMQFSEAADLLVKGAQLKNKKIREECQAVLDLSEEIK